MGRMPEPAVSFRTTTGMLVTGSIINPRILHSSSMLASRCPWSSPDSASVHLLAHQTIRSAPRDANLNILSQKILTRSRKIYDAVAGGSASPLAACAVMCVDKRFELAADKLFVADNLDLSLPLLQNS